jgi:hypothetical protein
MQASKRITWFRVYFIEIFAKNQNKSAFRNNKPSNQIEIFSKIEKSQESCLKDKELGNGNKIDSDSDGACCETKADSNASCHFSGE